jgi:hypothetical protein
LTYPCNRRFHKGLKISGSGLVTYIPMCGDEGRSWNWSLCNGTVVLYGAFLPKFELNRAVDGSEWVMLGVLFGGSDTLPRRWARGWLYRRLKTGRKLPSKIRSSRSGNRRAGTRACTPRTGGRSCHLYLAI